MRDFSINGFKCRTPPCRNQIYPLKQFGRAQVDYFVDPILILYRQLMTIPRLFSIALVVLVYFISCKYKDKDIFDLNQHRNSILKYFGEFKVEKFSEIVKSKKNAHNAFYARHEDVRFHQYVYRDVRRPYMYQSEGKYQIDSVQIDVNNLSLLTKIKLKTVGDSGVWLMDINSNEIVLGKKYYLKIRKKEDFDEEERGEHDILYFCEKYIEPL